MPRRDLESNALRSQYLADLSRDTSLVARPGEPHRQPQTTALNSAPLRRRRSFVRLPWRRDDGRI